MAKKTNLKIAIFEILKKYSPKRFDAWDVAKMFDHKNTQSVHMTLLRLSQQYENIYFERVANKDLRFYYEKKKVIR